MILIKIVNKAEDARPSSDFSVSMIKPVTCYFKKIKKKKKKKSKLITNQHFLLLFQHPLRDCSHKQNADRAKNEREEMGGQNQNAKCQATEAVKFLFPGDFWNSFVQTPQD
jgi:hypothetical protein